MEDKSINKFESSLLDDENKKLNKPESDFSLHMQWNIIRSIIDSETLYLDCLNTLNKVIIQISFTYFTLNKSSFF